MYTTYLGIMFVRLFKLIHNLDVENLFVICDRQKR